MSTPARIAAFVVAVLLAGGVGAALGSAVGPIDVGGDHGDAPATGDGPTHGDGPAHGGGPAGGDAPATDPDPAHDEGGGATTGPAGPTTAPAAPTTGAPATDHAGHGA